MTTVTVTFTGRYTWTVVLSRTGTKLLRYPFFSSLSGVVKRSTSGVVKSDDDVFRRRNHRFLSTSKVTTTEVDCLDVSVIRVYDLSGVKELMVGT